MLGLQAVDMSHQAQPFTLFSDSEKQAFIIDNIVIFSLNDYL
jgi:hypothetical protein